METRVLRLKRSWSYYQHDGNLELSSIPERTRLRLTGEPKKLVLLLRALEAGVPLADSVEHLSRASQVKPAAVESLLARLGSYGALVEAEPIRSDESDLYDRQARFFDLFERDGLSGKDFDRALRHRKVLMVGLGGYGTQLALLCSRIGIRRIVAIDPDRIELTNLSRQVLYTRSDLGERKIDVARRALTQVDPEIEFEGHADLILEPDALTPYLDDVALVFNTFGYPPNPSLEAVAIAAGRAGIPHLLAGGSWVGPLTIPGETACYWCLLSHRELAGVIQTSMGRYLHRTPDQPAGGVFAPRISVTVGIAVWEASRFLSGIDRPASLDGVLAFDLFNYARAPLIRVPRNPDCPVCSEWRPKTGKEVEDRD